MTDKRILKTRKCLKDALIGLTAEKPVEKITVKEICERANTGRVTFYTYYQDKYDLLAECFWDAQQRIAEAFRTAQKETNPDNDLSLGIQNLIVSILDATKDYPLHLDQLRNSPDILLMYYQFIMLSMGQFDQFFDNRIQYRYDRERLHSFLVLGLLGFIHGTPNTDPEKLRAQLRMLVDDLLKSPIFSAAET